MCVIDVKDEVKKCDSVDFPAQVNLKQLLLKAFLM